MIVSIMQPAYLPWLGYFHRLSLSDVHIILDSVPASKGDYFNRNRIRTANGWIWLTVPMHGNNDRMTQPIFELKANPLQRWAHKHWRSIENSYGRSPYFERYAPAIADVLSNPPESIEELCTRLLPVLLNAFDIHPQFVYSRDLDVAATKSDLVLQLCRRTEADTYVSGPFGRDYLDLAAFARERIAVRFHDYRHPSYTQAFAGFEPYMAAIDLLFNHGPRSREVLERDQPPIAVA